MSQLGLACHIYFSVGRCLLELAQGPSRVALAWHKAGGSTPLGVTDLKSLGEYSETVRQCAGTHKKHKEHTQNLALSLSDDGSLSLRKGQ